MKPLSKPALFFVFVGLCALLIWIGANFAQQSPVYARGYLELDPELEQDAADIRHLFLSVFDADSPLPMPYGAQRVVLSKSAKGRFYEFVLSKDNTTVMNTQRDTPQRLRVKARLDRDGIAGPDKKGDFTGETDALPIGSSGITLKIDKRIL